MNHPVPHPAVTDTSNYVRSLKSMIGAHPSVLYAQAVLRPSLALAQGHSLALIQGLDVMVYEYDLDRENASFASAFKRFIEDIKVLAASEGQVASVEVGEKFSTKKRVTETLRVAIRDDHEVKAVILCAAGSMILHDMGHPKLVKLTEAFAAKMEPVEKGYINHVVLSENRIKTTRNENLDNGDINDLCYPNIPEGAGKFVDRYLESSSSVLNLYGVGGTGKSTLMCKIAARSGRYTLLVDNPIIYRDAGLASSLMSHIRELCSDGQKVLVLFEEVDNYIREKTVDNDFLVQLLSLSSGVIKHDVKVLLASNLSNSDKVLDVLQRSGRTFGSVEFSKMTPAQASALRISMEMPEKEFAGDVTLAEAICDEVVRIGTDKVRTGFVG